MLVQAQRRANGATIHAGSVAAAVAGTTVMIEYHPGFYKFLVLEGTARTVSPRTSWAIQFSSVPGKWCSATRSLRSAIPSDVDIERFMKTSRFITDFPPLRSAKSIVAENQKQQREKSTKNLADTNLVIFGGGTQVSVTDQGQPGTP